MRIRLASFDLLGTLIAPRYPIHVQYARVFEPYLGPLNPDALKRSFGIALRQLQAEKPVYGKNTSLWWSEVIRRTALGAGAEPKVLDESLSSITPRLMALFSSKQGYMAFDDSLAVLHTLHTDFHVNTAVLSNADSRMSSVLRDLDFPPYLNPILLSEAQGIEKPSPEIFRLLLRRVNDERGSEPPITPQECVHVGDELECDYNGARSAGMHALLLERPGAENHCDSGVPIEQAHIVKDMSEVVRWLRLRI
ncbi:HAD hydrolase subfamily IA REG-2-like protein [Mycena vitilis]|nr:HAD hydrolase subfamily IA REG-2-like protein [Mycena vitilis]